ncbi:MAG: FtsX-like permease family protein [Mucilaginibacter sp.]|nr:FtsX-like permease family protein [Mucilaginibacter sp.]
MLSAIALIYVLMPFYNQLVGKQLSLNLFRPAYLGTLLGMGLVTGLLAGSYPAFLLSSFNPVTALKGSKLSNAANAVTVRKVLVISQFAAAVILIAATIVVYKQVHFIRQRNLGYSKSNLLYLDLQGGMKANFSGITNSLLATGEVENAAVSLHDALHVHSFGDGFGWQGKKPGTRLPIHSNVVSSGYIRTMHMQLLDGRDFNPGDMDSSSVIINQQMAGVMGESGKVGGLLFTGKHTMTVVGVIRDFIFNDIYGSSAPIVLFNGHSSATVMALRLKAGSNLPQALTRIAKVMNKENPGFPFEYRFADEDFGKLFADESLIGKLAGIFAMLAIFISCLGLFGLAAYTAERRTKEIGIRKVLGAPVASLSGLLAKEFLVLVAVSCLIAFPVAWWCMYNWLQNYAYRTTIAWWMVLLPALSALVIALVTVSVHAVKAALANPVKSLRSD